MDRQIAEMKRLNKKTDDIVYVHVDEIVIIRRTKTDNSTSVFLEIRVDISTNVKTTRILAAREMTDEQFEMSKKFMDEDLTSTFNADWLQTYKNVCFDSLEETDLVCVSSPETEMIEREEQLEAERLEAINPLRRTMENAESIMNACLSETQKRRFKMHYFEGKTTREIALKESIAQRSVMDSLDYANKKIEKYFKKLKKAPLKTPKFSI